MAESSKLRSGLTWTGIAALFVALRLLAISHYDWKTAFNVIDTIDVNDAASIAMGTLMAESLVGGVALAVLLGMTAVRQWRLRHDHERAVGGFVWLIAIAVFVAAHVRTFRSWWLPVITLLIGTILWLALRYRLTRLSPTMASLSLARFGLATTAVVLVVAATVTTPWVPYERIATEQGVVRGYVLDTPSGYLKVLTDHPRRMVTLETADVTSREEL